ncbi:MAG: hypothetical protein ABFS14_00390 [Gemmatimonadota bacterium]
MTQRPRVRAAALLGFIGIAAACGPAQAQIGSARWRPEDRVLITDFSVVRALAKSTDRLFAATDGGLVIFDELRRRFELPLTVEDGYPAGPVTAMAYDPRDASLWIVGRDRELLQFDVRDWRIRERQALREAVVSVVPEAVGSDLLLQFRTGWIRYDAFSRRSLPASAREAAAAIESRPDLRRRQELLRDPGFQSVSAFLPRSPGGRRFAITDVMPTRDPALFWVATDGAAVLEYDQFARRWETILFGPVGGGSAGIAELAGNLWFVPAAPLEGRYAVARTDPDLQRWAAWDSDSLRSAPRRADVVLADQRTPSLWVGGSDGLYVFEGEVGAWRRIAELPSEHVTALAPASLADGTPGIWVGTRRGAVVLGSSGVRGPVLLGGRDIRAVVQSGSRVWFGTRSGLLPLDIGSLSDAAAAGATGPSRAPGSGALNRPVGALDAYGDTVYAGLDDEIWIWSPGEEWSRVEAIGRVGGPVTAISAASGTVWVGSAEGIVRWQPDGGPARRMSFAAGDLPRSTRLRGVRSILPVDFETAWLALPAGAFRITMLP